MEREAKQRRTRALLEASLEVLAGRSNWILLVAGVAISAVALWSLFSRIEPAAIYAAIRYSDKQTLTVALAIIAGTTALRGWRMQLWSGRSGRRWLPNALVANSFGYVALLLIPARLGEFIRMELIARGFSMSRSELLGVLTVERAVDLTIIVVIMALGMLGMERPGPGSVLQHVDTFRVVLFVLAVAGVAALLYALLHLGVMRRLASLLPLFVRLRAEQFAGGLVAAVRRAKGGLAVSLLIWVLEIVTLHLVLAAFSIDVSLFEVLLLMALMTLSFVIPSGPAGLGLWQWVFVFALPEAGADRAVAASVAVQALSLAGFMMVGTAAAVWLGIHRKVIQKSLR